MWARRISTGLLAASVIIAMLAIAPPAYASNGLVQQAKPSGIDFGSVALGKVKAKTVKYNFPRATPE
jgi:hypothetical protein